MLLSRKNQERIDKTPSDNSVIFFKDILKSKLSRRSDRKKLKGSEVIKTLITDELDEKQYYKNTYVLDTKASKQLYFLTDILESYGLTKSNDRYKKHLFGIVGNNYYETYFFIINNFENTNSFDNLFGLYYSLKTYYSDFFKSNYPNLLYLSSNTKLLDLNNKVYTIHSNKLQSKTILPQILNILNIYNDETLTIAKKLLLEEYGNNGIFLTEYKNNLMIYKGLKMHLRAYMLFTIINNTFKSYLFDKGQIITAKETFKNDEWNNRDIHNVYLENNPNLIFPNDLYKHNTTPYIKDEHEFYKLWGKCIETVKIISTIASSNIYNYANTINSFQVFEIDIAITNDFNIYISDIKTEDKFENNLIYPNAQSLRKPYFDWIHETVIKPALFPNLETNINKDYNANIPIYEIEYTDF